MQCRFFESENSHMIFIRRYFHLHQRENIKKRFAYLFMGKMAHNDIIFVEYKEKNLKDYTLIEGLPGMGLVGTIAAKYIIEKLKFDEYGYIESGLFLPVVRIHQGIPVRPARIYISDSRKLVVLISEQIIPKNHTYALAKSVSDWIQKKGITRLVSLSGIHAYDNDPEQPILYGIAANEKSKETLKKHGLN